MNIAYVQHGEWGGPYRTVMADGVAVDATYPLNPYKSGYGAAIPTPYRILYRSHWRRVYAACYSNQSSTYVRIDGVDTLVDIHLD